MPSLVLSGTCNIAQLYELQLAKRRFMAPHFMALKGNAHLCSSLQGALKWDVVLSLHPSTCHHVSVPEAFHCCGGPARGPERRGRTACFQRGVESGYGTASSYVNI